MSSKLKSLITLVSLLCGRSYGQNEQATLLEDTPVHVYSVSSHVSSKPKLGDPVLFRVTDNVWASVGTTGRGILAIPAAADVAGKVVAVHGHRFRRTEVDVKLEYVESVTGEHVPVLLNTCSKRPDESGRPPCFDLRIGLLKGAVTSISTTIYVGQNVTFNSAVSSKGTRLGRAELTGRRNRLSLAGSSSCAVVLQMWRADRKRYLDSACERQVRRPF